MLSGKAVWKNFSTKRPGNRQESLFRKSYNTTSSDRGPRNMRGSLFLLAAFLVTPHKEHCVDTAAGRPAACACRQGDPAAAP